MSVGTITLTNGSAVVGGTGTSFTTELAAGDFIVSTVGGVPYTLPVKTVDSNTQLTLVSNFYRANAIRCGLVSSPACGLEYGHSSAGCSECRSAAWTELRQTKLAAGLQFCRNITVKLPDGTTFTGPSWKYLSDNMATKSGGAVPVNQGGTGSTTASGARTNLG